MPATPLRVLMMIHTRWSRNLGAPRVQLELGEELTRLGCRVEKYSYEDAFPRARGGRGRLARVLETLLENRSFAKRAARFVRARGHNFDVIDANQTDLPFAKPALGFAGLLVARSVGLMSAYEDFERRHRRTAAPGRALHGLAHRALAAPARRRRLRDAERSFAAADLVNVSNRDDLATLGARPDLAGKVVHFPFGLSAERREALRSARGASPVRRSPPTTAFIGTWNHRKGAGDWPAIVARVRRRVPAARFLLLGTSIPVDAVAGDFAADDRGALDIVPFFDGDRLPTLLAGADAGAFPGYLEGFGFGVLEKLAAGLPTVTYDAPGARETMAAFGGEWMTPPGASAAFADRLVEILTAPADAYRALVARAHAAADRFAWSDIAAATLATYAARLAALRR